MLNINNKRERIVLNYANRSFIINLKLNQNK